MKKIIFIVSILFSVAAFAQKDAKAKNILDLATQKYTEAGGIDAYFSMNIKDTKAKVTHSFDGKIQMKGNKFYFSTPENAVWFDGDTQWAYLKNNEEVNVTKPGEEETQMMNPAAIFELYKKGCKYKYNGEKKDIKSRLVYEVELSPENKKGEIQKLQIQFNKTDYMPVMFQIFYKNNLQNVIYINTYKTKQILPDNTFVFDKKKYPDAEIIDLR